ncbi:hypothetical protein Y032_0283g1313 [Ancylostoma ceylanicum]|uniref:Uncharacterized protein n=1 Tax=Ancylostoma ceylanicum TaxID=53326 RepID=A0A016S6B0_9BILA|nr:hypothetical protein Y032_0283g1313 [Ancylostoma ceylanicum]
MGKSAYCLLSANVEESITQCSKILKFGGVLLGEGVPERGQGYRVWQRGPCLLLLLRTSRQIHMRVIFVDQKMHLDSPMSLLSVYADHRLELTIVQIDVTHSVACQQIWKSTPCS